MSGGAGAGPHPTPAPRFRLGINTCFAVKRWPRPEDWAAVVRTDLGLDLVELSADLLEGMEVPGERSLAIARTRAALADHGLVAETTFTGLNAFGSNLLMHPDPKRRAASVAWYRSLVDVTAELGAAATGGHVGTMSVPDWMAADRREARMAALRESLGEIAGHARRAGLEFLMLENLPSPREPSTFAWIDDLLTEGDETHVPWRLCYDVGHTCTPGATDEELDPYAWPGRFAGRIAEVQLQQTDGLGDHHWQFTAARNRAGVIDAAKLLQALETTTSGDIRLILEIIPPGEQSDDEVLAELKESVDYWREAIDAHGSRDAAVASGG
jgi:D-erythrulose 1-phosphate 3-epimerase